MIKQPRARGSLLRFIADWGLFIPKPSYHMVV